MKKKVLVIGAGISGLASAYRLVEHGYQVTIISKEFSPNTTSNKAAAFWFPFHVRNDQRATEWSKKSYYFFETLAKNSLTGISMFPLLKASKPNSNDEDSWMDFMPEGSFAKLSSMDLPIGYEIGYSATVPLIETQIFLPWLMNELMMKGVQFLKDEISSLAKINNDYEIIVNCSALGARNLCKDYSVIPVRGQVVLLEPNNFTRIFLDNQNPTYIVPRKDATIIGGTYEENIFDTTTVANDLSRLLKNALDIFPTLETKNVIGNWAGLRPFRDKVRLESDGNIIHNYGHGGSGFTLSFGCADEVVSIANSIYGSS